MRLALLVFFVLAACGSKKNTKGATEFVGATLAVDEKVHRVFRAVDGLRFAELAGRKGIEAVDELVELMGSIPPAAKYLANQPRVSPGGDLAACADGWFAASDALQAAFAPIVAVLEKGSSGEGHELEDLWRVRAAWAEQEAEVKTRLCDLARAGAVCGAALKPYDFESVHRFEFPGVCGSSRSH